MRKRSKKGLFIVIEGVDGVGKSTQFELLRKFLEEKKLKVKTIKFPQYEKSFGGTLVKRYLNGEFGDQNSISTYLIAPLYAIDRFEAKKQLASWINTGKAVLSDRYMMSNLAFRSASVDTKEVDKYLDWNCELEYKIFGIPKEDLVIFLFAPIEFIWKKMDEKRSGREYAKNTRDIHEKDFLYLKRVQERYLYLAKKYKHIVKIDCVKNGNLRSIESIHKEVLRKIGKLLK